MFRFLAGIIELISESAAVIAFLGSQVQSSQPLEWARSPLSSPTSLPAFYNENAMYAPLTREGLPSKNECLRVQFQ